MADRISIRFRGRPRSADPELALWAALEEDRLAVLQRSIRYHRPRAPFCGVGFCTQCIVRVNGQPNVRACQYRPREGDEVETENAWPSPQHDAYGAIDVAFPHGIDTVHGFRRPAFLTPFYHRVIRRLAGFGRAPDRPAPPLPPGDRLETSVLVVGAGVAGRSVAETLAGHSVPACVVDDSALSANASATGRTQGRVVFLPPPDPQRSYAFEAVVARDGGAGLLVSARHVVLAPGGYDAHLIFPGNDRPGVVTAEAAFRMSPGATPPPFRQALVFGGDQRALEVLERFPESVVAVAAPGAINPEMTRGASERGVRLYPHVLLSAARGTHRVRSVLLSPRGAGPALRLEVDAIVLAHRRLPSPQLLFQAGARMHWDTAVGHYLPDIDANGGTTVPGLFAAGEVAGFRTPEAATESGRRSAEAIASSVPAESIAVPSPELQPHPLEAYYRELVRNTARRGKCIVCPCEDVLLQEVEAANAAGYRGIEVIKRFTGVGTGLCQGRYCVPEVLLLLAVLERRAPAEVGYLTQRPPVVPVRLDVLAGLPPDAE